MIDTRLRSLRRQRKIPTLRIPFATYDDATTAHWDNAIPGGPHLLISGAGGSGRTYLIRTIAEQLATRRVSTVFIGWRPEERIPASETLICGSQTGCDPDGLLRAAQTIRAIADTRTRVKRAHRVFRRPGLFTRRPRPLVIIIDDAEQVLTYWAHYRTGHAISPALAVADPLAALNSVLALGRVNGTSVCLSVQRPETLTLSGGHLSGVGSVIDTFATRCALDTHDARSAHLLWGDPTIRDPRRGSIQRDVGRAFVTHPGAGVAAATVWLTAQASHAAPTE